MESVMMIFFIILMIFFTYGYSSFYFYKHRTDQKTIFIPKNNEDDSFVVGGQSNGQTDNPNDNPSDNPTYIPFDSSSTCDPNASYSFDGDNSMFCLNGGKCLESGSGTNIYNCSCVETFSGNNCRKNVGQKIDIMDNFTSPTEITRVAMFDKNNFIQYNDYL
jgi:hypothetical protein